MAYEDVASNYEDLRDHELRLKELKHLITRLADRISALESKVG